MSEVDAGGQASGDANDADQAREQQVGAEAVFPDLKLGAAWAASITKHRAATLEQRLQAWEQEADHGERKGPFDNGSGRRGVGLTGADVFWLASRTLARTSEAQVVAELASRLLDLRSWDLPKAVVSLDALHLEGANLAQAHLEGTCLAEAHLEGANLTEAHLEGAQLIEAHLKGASLAGVHLEGAYLWGARMEGASLIEAHLEGASLDDAHLEGASLHGVHLEGKVYPPDSQDYLRTLRLFRVFPQTLKGADLRGAYFDSGTDLRNVVLGKAGSGPGRGYVRVADVRWGGVNLAVQEWTYTRRAVIGILKHVEAIELGDEREARTVADEHGKPKDRVTRLHDFADAVRANRQLATALRSQGLSDDADRFAYKAQRLQRQALRYQGRYGAALGSWFLDLIAGYGYRPMRSFLTYLLVVLGFATGYFLLRLNVKPPLSPVDAIVFSITSFHGRGFSPGESVTLHNPLTILAAIEAIIGLLIEITFIATFTQRFFAR